MCLEGGKKEKKRNAWEGQQENGENIKIFPDSPAVS